MDRQDIDALLIGALYGELTPADEARLAAHLESHPADRGALDDLHTARQAVKESRIFDVQLDPPQAVSALLLQEAHRRAPKRVVASDEQKEGWFARFARAFMAHPAMAAAAMLVVVIGVAGTLYVKKGDHSAAKEVSAPASGELQKQESAPVVAATPEGADQGTATGSAPAGSAYQVGLADETVAKDQKAEPTPPKKETASDRWRGRADAEKNAEKKKAPSKGIAVTTKSPQPKEIGDDKADTDGFGIGGATTGAAAPGRAAGGGGAAGPVANAQQPPPPAQAGMVPTSPAPAAAPKATTTATTKPADSTEAGLVAWAKSQHAGAIAAVQNKDCRRAAQYAIAVSQKAPDYYAAFMATDRQLKACQTYIAGEVQKDADKSNKTRAQKRINADEPALESK